MVKRAFISFDFDHDEDLRILLAGQSKHPDSPFEIKDRSIKEPLVGDWKQKVRRRMNNVDIVIVICGEFTHLAIPPPASPAELAQLCQGDRYRADAGPRTLALYFFGRDSQARNQVRERTTSGNVTINDTLLHYAVDDLPFGVVGASGIGAYHGEERFKTLSHAKGVFQQARWNLAGLLRSPFGWITGLALAYYVEALVDGKVVASGIQPADIKERIAALPPRQVTHRK